VVFRSSSNITNNQGTEDMKKILSTVISVALGSALLSSCIEEYDPQTSTVTVDQVANAPGAFDKAVANLTGNLCGEFQFTNTRVYDFGYPAFFLTRDVEGQDFIPVGTNNWFQTWYEDFGYLGPNWLVTQLPWRWYYKWIKSCNEVIAQAGATDYATPADDKKAGAGIAYALRAMHYFDLCRMYAAAPYAVKKDALTTVKVTEASDLASAANNPRMTWNEAFDFILADLNAAEALLAGYTRADVYTPDLSVVYGLKARVYLEMQNWEEAKNYAQKAMQGYTMMSKDEYLSRDYGFNSPNSSWMFGLTFKSTDANILENDGDSSWGSVMILENGFECGYAANYGGPNVIDRHLFETIPATDFRKNLWVDFSLDQMSKDDAIAALANYSNYPERVYASGVEAASYGLGGLSLKFRNAAGKADVKYDAWVVAVPLMRVEEMKLIEAEAAGMLNEADGIAKLTAFAQTRDPNYVYGTHNEAYYNTSTSAFQNEVWWQRRVELWGEGFATFDIKRLNKGIIRSYAGTNHIEGSRFNSETLPQWMVWCFVGTEADENAGLDPNPTPTRPEGDSPEYEW
jgi:hypothetical protein